MKVYELAKKLGRTSKEILQAARYLEILVQSHLSSLSDEEVKQIIKYFRKRRLLFFFKRYFSLFLLIFLVTILFFIINPQSVVSGEIDASVNESGELTIDWEFNDSIESGIIFIESESEIFLIEVFEVSGNTVECCYDENLAISIFLTDKDGNEDEIEAKNIEVPDNVSTSTTLSISTTTSSTLPECNDEDFKPYTLYDSDGNANTVMSCSNEQDALNSGFIYTVNPKPPQSTSTTTTVPPTTTTVPPTTTSSTTTTSTTTTVPPTTTSSTTTTSTTTTVPPTTTSTTLFNLLPDSEEIIRKTYKCRLGINKKGKELYYFQFTSTIKSDTRDLKYRLSYSINGNAFKDTKLKKFPKKQNRDLTIKYKRFFSKKKFQIETFEYSFKYEYPNGDIGETSVYTVDKKLPCGFYGQVPTTTTTSIPIVDRNLRFTDDTDIRIPNITVPPTTTSSTTTSSTTTSSTTTSSTSSTTTSSTTTSSTLPECNDEDFKPYTLYDSDGNANTVMSCSNEQDALNSGFIYTVNPKPPPPTTTTTSTTTTTTSTTTTTIPDPSSTVSQSLGSCSGPSGTRTSTLSITNNESYTAYYLVEYSTNNGSSYTTAQTNQSISGGATNTTNTVVVSDGGSIIWRYKDSRTSNDFSIASYVTLSTSDTVDCPDGYYVNVDGSNTYALNVECRKWNDTTKVRFRANPWWGDYDLAKDYMFALIALTGDYDDGDTDVEVEDYFDHSQWSCSVIPGAYFAYEKGFVQFIGQAITAPSWNSTTDVEDGSSNNRDFYVFAEQVP